MLINIQNEALNDFTIVQQKITAIQNRLNEMDHIAATKGKTFVDTALANQSLIEYQTLKLQEHKRRSDFTQQLLENGQSILSESLERHINHLEYVEKHLNSQLNDIVAQVQSVSEQCANQQSDISEFRQQLEENVLYSNEHVIVMNE